MQPFAAEDGIELEQFRASARSARESLDVEVESRSGVGAMDRREREPLIPASSSSHSSSSGGSTPRCDYRRGCRTDARGNLSSQSGYKSVTSSSAGPTNSTHLGGLDLFSQPSRFKSIMEKISQSKVGRLVDKLHVESEPGLTTTQLMLTNHDLKPVEPERRQWGAWNFVGFWIGM